MLETRLREVYPHKILHLNNKKWNFGEFSKLLSRVKVNLSKTNSKWNYEKLTLKSKNPQLKTIKPHNPIKED